MPYLQLNKLKSRIKNGTEATLNLSLNVNVISNSIDETSCPNKLLQTDRLVPVLRKAFTNNSSANINLSKTQLSKITQLGEFLVQLLRPPIKTGLAFKKPVPKPLAKHGLIPLILTAAALATDTAIQ